MSKWKNIQISQLTGTVADPDVRGQLVTREEEGEVFVRHLLDGGEAGGALAAA